MSTYIETLKETNKNFVKIRIEQNRNRFKSILKNAESLVLEFKMYRDNHNISDYVYAFNSLLRSIACCDLSDLSKKEQNDLLVCRNSISSFIEENHLRLVM